jgi:predicted Zn-dependent peptidase
MKEYTSFERNFDAAVFGENHPYARPGMSRASIDRIKRDTTLEWARRYVVPANSTLIITGQFDPDVVRKYIEHAVAGIDAGVAAAQPEPTNSPPMRRRVTGITATATPTLALELAFRGPAGVDRSYAERLVLEKVLEARLRTLREKEALSYTFFAQFIPGRGGGMWRLSGDVDASRATAAATALLHVTDEMRADPSTYRAAFVLAREKVLAELMSGGTTSRAVADQLEQIARFGLSDGFYVDLARDVAHLTFDRFSAFVATELAAEREVRAAFGNKPAVDAADAVFSR